MELKLELPPFEPRFILNTLSDNEKYDWNAIDLNIPEIHKETKGEDIKIAIIDSGKCEHFETLPATEDCENFSESDTANDIFSHSSFIAGIIAAQQNERGIIGIAPKSKLYFAKAIEDNGQGNPSSIIKSIKWCIDKKVDIISISAGMFIDYKPLHEIIIEAFKQNIIIVAAAGNSGVTQPDIAFPARYPEVIAVGAYDKKRLPAAFSSRGLNIAFSMPGVDIYSTYLNNQYCLNSGTSFACPTLAAVIALLLSKHKSTPSLTPCDNFGQIMEHLKKYSINLGDPKATGFGTIDTQGIIHY